MSRFTLYVMEKENKYSEHINNYDLDSLVEIAHTDALAADSKSELIEALETTISYLDYEYSCGKMSDIGPDYLDAVCVLGKLKGAKEYLGISNYYFFLIEIRETASLVEKLEWFKLLEENINEARVHDPGEETFIYNKIHYYRELSKAYGHADPKIVRKLFDLLLESAKQFPNSGFWTSWLYTLIDFKEAPLPQVSEIANQSMRDFILTSESLYRSKQMDPIEFYRQLGAYNFLKVLPEEIKIKISFWIHAAIQAEKAIIGSLSTDRLRDQGILFINAYENHLKTTEVVEHAVELNTLSWQGFSNWNSLLFYLRAKVLHAGHLKAHAHPDQCLDVFAEAFSVAEAVRLSLDLYKKDNFSFGSPLLEFYQDFALHTPDETERLKLVKIRLDVAHSTIATGEGSYLFPFEHHMECAAYLSRVDDFKRSWMQMCIVLCRYAHSIYEHWKNHDFVTKNKALAELLQTSAFLFSESWEFNLHRYHKKYPVILHTLTDAELDAEFGRFIDYAKNHKAERFGK